MGKSVCIIEPDGSGHRLMYVELLAARLLGEGHRVTLATATCVMKHPYLQSLLDDTNFEVLRMDWGVAVSSLGNLGAQVKAWRQIHRSSSRILSQRRIDLFVLPYGDYIGYVGGLLGSPFSNVPWITLLLRPSFHYRKFDVLAPHPKFAQLKRLLLSRMIRDELLDVVGILDPWLAEFLAVNSRLEKVRYVPDPQHEVTQYSKAASRAVLGIDPMLPTLLVYGAMDPRKNIRGLIDAVKEAPGMQIVFAGVQDEDTRRLLNRWRDSGSCHRLIDFDRYVSAKEHSLLFSAADAVWVDYVGHYGMSGVLINAASFGVPAIGCAAGMIGRLIDANGIGVVVDDDGENRLEAILHAFEMSSDPQFRARARGFSEAHHPDRFVEGLLGEWLQASSAS